MNFAKFYIGDYQRDTGTLVIDEIDRLWRSLPEDHMWTGWAAASARPIPRMTVR